MRDFGLKVPVQVWTDSSAALGISTRSGLGKLWHLETHTLWVQEKVRTGAIQVRKVRGDLNPADLFIKLLPSKDNTSAGSAFLMRMPIGEVSDRAATSTQGVLWWQWRPAVIGTLADVWSQG